jgi:voltage-gated potassium channel Kch
MLGFYKIASSFSYEIEQRNSALKEQIRIIDFNPDVLRKLKKRGFDAQYGDIANIDNLHHLGISEAKVVISTIPDSILRGTNNMNILKSVKNLAPEAKVFVTSEDIKTALALYDAGADYVIMPRILTVYQLVPLIERASAWLKIGRATPNYSHLKERIEILG